MDGALLRRHANCHNARPALTLSAMIRTLTAAWLASLSALALAQQSPPGPLPPEQPVAGHSQLEWSQRWWQWAFSFDETRSPVADRTGQYCASRQSGEVWFLAGTYGSRRTQRSCRIPSGKYLFFPIVNYISSRPEGNATSCAALMKRAASLTDAPSALALEVDGQRFDASRIPRLAGQSCFSLVPGTPADAASNGYFVMLPPLSKGRHLIEFVGMLPSLAQAVSYTLDVD